MEDLTKRAQQAAQIVQEPAKYMVCEGCESIILKIAHICPNCHGYRFDESPQKVVAQAKLLGSRPQTSVKPEDLEG